jgi:hypothetical protein
MSERPLYTPPFTQDARWLVQSPLYQPDQCAAYYQSTIDAFCQLRHKAQKGLLNDLEAPFIQQKKSPAERRHTLKTIVVFGTAKDIGFVQPMTSVIQSWVPVQSAWPRVLFYDTIDPRLFWEMMSCTQLDTAHFFFVSSTGHAPQNNTMSCLPLHINGLYVNWNTPHRTEDSAIIFHKPFCPYPKWQDFNQTSSTKVPEKHVWVFFDGNYTFPWNTLPCF